MKTKNELEKELCCLASRYYDEYGSFETDILTEENNECHIQINREWINGR